MRREKNKPANPMSALTSGSSPTLREREEELSGSTLIPVPSPCKAEGGGEASATSAHVGGQRAVGSTAAGFSLPEDGELGHTRERGRAGEGRKYPPGTLGLLVYLLEWLKGWLALLARIAATSGRHRARKLRPWHLRIGTQSQPVALRKEQVNRLLQRHHDLKDVEKIAALSARFRTPEGNFFADPVHVERLMRRILEENPPWLYVGRVLAGGEEGGETHSQEFIWREQVVREVQDVTLFVPDESWRDQPLSSMTLRPARTLQEVWQARLLDQILPPEILVDKRNRGEILIPIRQGTRQRLEFRPEQRRLEVTVRKPVPIPIEMEGGSGRGGQLLYILLDYSASMQGKSATLAMAVIAAALRANMGQRDTRYLFRRYAEEMWPRVVERPVQARTLAEKDALLDTILSTNFNGAATHVNDALNVAVTDIQNLRREEQLEATLLLVTDGRAEILESTRLRLLEAMVKVHTVMVMPERNPSLEALSESFTALDISPDLPDANRQPAPAASPAAPHRRAYHI